jgi:PilZ domain
LKVEQDSITEICDSEGTPSAKSSDARCAVRFPVHLPVQVVTPSGEFETQTENVSASGVLFFAEKSLEVDTEVEMFLRMPAATIGAEEDVVIQCMGRVTRCSSDSDGSRVAALIDDYRFGKQSGS